MVPQLAALASWGGLARLLTALRARDEPLSRAVPNGRVRCGREAPAKVADPAPLQQAVQPAQALGVRTVFNILGPLLNPASCAYFLIGVYSEALVPLMGEALHNLGVEMAMVVHCGGLDELAPIAVATIATVRVPRPRAETRLALALSTRPRSNPVG